jgi:hypothetical protein
MNSGSPGLQVLLSSSVFCSWKKVTQTLVVSSLQAPPSVVQPDQHCGQVHLYTLITPPGLCFGHLYEAQRLKIWCSHSRVAETPTLLGCDTMSLSQCSGSSSLGLLEREGKGTTVPWCIRNYSLNDMASHPLRHAPTVACQTMEVNVTLL